MKSNWVFLFLSMGLLISCGNTNEDDMSNSINANSTCVLAIEGMMCEKGCKTTIQQRLSDVEGVVSCAVDYENKKADLDFDSNVVTPDELIDVVNKIAGGIYIATLLEESVFIPAAGSGNIKGGVETNETSVRDFGFQLPDFTSIFPNSI